MTPGVGGRIPARLAWAVRCLEVEPADRLLEVGCGTGIAVDLVCGRLRGGHITAIDRSPAMVAHARRRNARHVAAGLARLECVALHAAELGRARFTKCFGVNVNLFWTRRPTELEALATALVPGGRLYLFYQPPSAGKVARITDAVLPHLRTYGFRDPEATVEGLPGGPGLFLRATAGR